MINANSIFLDKYKRLNSLPPYIILIILTFIMLVAILDVFRTAETVNVIQYLAIIVCISIVVLQAYQLKLLKELMDMTNCYSSAKMFGFILIAFAYQPIAMYMIKDGAKRIAERNGFDSYI